MGLSAYKINEILFSYRQKAESRSHLANKKDMELRQELLKHHPKLYLKSYIQHIEIYNYKIKKYKKMLIGSILLILSASLVIITLFASPS